MSRKRPTLREIEGTKFCILRRKVDVPKSKSIHATHAKLTSVHSSRNCGRPETARNHAVLGVAAR